MFISACHEIKVAHISTMFQENELASAKLERAQVETLKREISNQEVHWKKAYDILLAENIALKSSGAEALLAAQWRHRYETCLRDKENLDTQRKMLMERVENFSDEADRGDVGKYHIKYKELKESFRSYRKKAKEIFQELQQGNNGVSIRYIFQSLIIFYFLLTL